jgi:hypothetical protein
LTLNSRASSARAVGVQSEGRLCRNEDGPVRDVRVRCVTLEGDPVGKFGVAGRDNPVVDTVGERRPETYRTELRGKCTATVSIDCEKLYVERCTASQNDRGLGDAGRV